MGRNLLFDAEWKKWAEWILIRWASGHNERQTLEPVEEKGCKIDITYLDTIFQGYEESTEVYHNEGSLQLPR